MKILVVDDDDAIRSVLRIALSVDDAVDEVREARDGPDALRAVRDFDPDIVLLDFWMPVMDGREVAERIRVARPGALIVAFSGVLDDKPEWADHLCVKGELPDIASLVRLLEVDAAS